LLVGQKLSAGSALADVPIPISTTAQAKASFGDGSMLHRMVTAFIDNNFAAQLWCLPVVEPAGGVAATGTITVSNAGPSFAQAVTLTDPIPANTTFVSLAASVFAAYAIERLRFKGSRQIGLAIFLAYLIPPSILFIPLAMMVFQVGLFDTRWALILTYPTFLIPFCTWLLMGYFKTIPKELEECARIDGATRFGAMIRIIFPIAVPGILSAGIFAFTLSWNEFIYALVFLSSPEKKTVPVGVVSELIRGDIYFWGQLMAGALLGSIPVAIVYSFFVEYYVTGLTGSVKG